MMTVEDVASVVAEAQGEAVVVSTMSAMAFGSDAGARGTGGGALDFRVLGVMGAAGSLGLGLAIGRPDRDVWVVDGDGSLLMQLGCLAAVGGARPERLTHVVIANGVYAVSGAQPLPVRPDWPALALAAGYAGAAWAHSPAELAGILGAADPGPRLIAAVCDPARPDYPNGAFDFDASGQGAALRAALGAP
jgi:thiamine pyrophosphate-dependent acetolactate synthase large subunit-like protein